MNPRNPTDNLFRKRLEHYQQEAPMHLWNEIDGRRTWQHRLKLRARRSQPALVLTLLLLSGALLGTLVWPERPPALSSFPIPASGTPPMADRQTPAPSAPLSMPAFPATLVSADRASSHPGGDKAALPAVKHAPKTEDRPLQASEKAMAEIQPQTFPARPDRKNINSTPRSLPAFALVLPDRDPQCVRFGEPKHWHFYADLSAGPTVPFRRLQAESPEYEAYAQARENTESPRLSYHAQLRLSAVTHFGLALRTGLSYTQYSEKFDFTDNSEEKITITNVYGSNGEIIGTDTIVEKGMLRQVAQNNYRLLDFPILLGYEWRRPNWTIAFTGGPVVNMLFRTSGKFLSPEEMSPTDFSSDDAANYPAFRREVGIGWYAGLGLHYKLQDDLQLLIEPHFRINPQSVTRNEYVLNQRYMSTGISIGLRKQI